MTVACVKVFPKQRNLNLPYVLLSALATILTAVALTLRIIRSARAFLPVCSSAAKNCGRLDPARRHDGRAVAIDASMSFWVSLRHVFVVIQQRRRDPIAAAQCCATKAQVSANRVSNRALASAR
jgi:predicted membrane-bound dolichyl-phosphate-mannose-protein mannosyltransferase